MATSGAATRESILTVASDLYAAKGYAAVSMRDVAARVGVTPANLYYYFKNKDDLIDAALAHVFADKVAPLAAILERDLPPRDRLRLFVEYFVTLIFTERTFSNLIFRELLECREDLAESRVTLVLDKPFRLLAGLMRDCAAPGDPVLSAISVVGLVLGHLQLGNALRDLPGVTPVHGDPGVVAAHVYALLDRSLPGGAGASA